MKLAIELGPESSELVTKVAEEKGMTAGDVVVKIVDSFRENLDGEDGWDDEEEEEDEESEAETEDAKA